MRKTWLLAIVSLISLSFLNLENKSWAEDAEPAAKMKEWTFLVFLNGKNNLDYFGALNVNQMEQVGSTADINVVVQWGSLKNKTTKRLYVKQDNNTNAVTSPVIQDLGNVDMGDWKSLVDFVRWGVENYPAKHYFINVWNHGSGWHYQKLSNHFVAAALQPMDISWDDQTGNHITTQQLGQALSESARLIGHKVDLYASDACLMAMAEVANEVSDSVHIYAGSEEVEAGAGWPYHQILKRWAAHPQSTPAEVGTLLTEEFVKSYGGGESGYQDATFSAFDLDKMSAFNTSVVSLGSELTKLDSGNRAKVLKAAKATQNFTYRDYGDLGDFLSLLEKAEIQGLKSNTTTDVKAAIREFVIANATTPNYSKATGVAIWLPTSMGTFSSYVEKYRGLKFNKETRWADVLQAFLK